MERVLEVAILPWRFCAYAGWLMFVIPALAWQGNR